MCIQNKIFFSNSDDESKLFSWTIICNVTHLITGKNFGLKISIYNVQNYILQKIIYEIIILRKYRKHLNTLLLITFEINLKAFLFHI